MLLFSGILPKLGFFLAQLCLDTQVRGKIGKIVSFSSSSIARKTMVEMLYHAPQWEIPQAWFISFLIGFFLAQLIISFLLLNAYHAPRNHSTLVMEMLDVKNKILCDSLQPKIAHGL